VPDFMASAGDFQKKWPPIWNEMISLLEPKMSPTEAYAFLALFTEAFRRFLGVKGVVRWDGSIDA